MLKYKLIEENNSRVLYKYFPENGSESGLVTIDKETGKCDVEKLAPNDEHRIYALKMFKKLREFLDAKSFDESGSVAWY